MTKIFKDIEAAVDAEDDTPDNHRNAPRPSPDCLYGLIGEIATTGSETTEANPFAIAANTMAYLGCAVGRGPYMPIGDTKHHTRINTLHIGRSGEGRKGDAVSLVKRIARRIEELDEHASPQIHDGGLSSREGLVFMIHDGYREGKEEVPAIEDKRLLVIESEFVNTLQQAKRHGNTLSAGVRDLWDGQSLRPATKTNRLWASNPHVCLAAAITPSELVASLASKDMTNGFMNRFMPIVAERPKMLPFPKATPQEEVDRLAGRVLEVLEFCNAKRWVETDVMRVELSDDADRRWRTLYLGELNDRRHGERINALIERRAPMLLRMAMLFALCDLTTTVEVHHLNAALAWIRYSVESVKFVFASGADEMEVEETNETATKIVGFLTARGCVTRWQITSDCFKGHANKARIDAALDELLTTTPPRIEVYENRTGPGRPTKFYRLTANNAKKAKNDHSCGFAGDFGLREVSEQSEVNAICVATDTSQLRLLRKQQGRPETHANASTSLSSLSSRGKKEKPFKDDARIDEGAI